MRAISFLALLFIFAWPALRAQALTLEEYLGEVRAANVSVRSSRLKAEALERRVRPESTWDDPFIAAGLDEIPFDGASESVIRRYQISQSVPFPGKLSAKARAAESRAQAAVGDAETVSREISINATQTFYRVYFLEKAIALNNRLKESLGETVGSAKARYRSGDRNHHDWLLARSELAILEIDGLKLQREKRAIDATFNELRNQAPTSIVGSLSVDLNSKNQENEVDPDLGSQPELKSLRSMIRISEAERDFAKLSYFPDFVFQGMMMQPNSEMGEMTKKSTWGFMIGMNLPLFFWRKQSDLIASTNLNREATVLEERALSNRLNTEVVDAGNQLKTARDIVKLYQETVIPTTKMAAASARTGYSSRKLPLTQLTEVLRAERTQSLELLAAQIDVELAKVRLKEILSSPPLLRLAPSRPTLFGSGGMGTGSMSNESDTVSMGRGMRPPVKNKNGTGNKPASGGGAGMGGM